MSHEWGLIVRGFAIATLGAIASMLYIVGLSAIFVGRFPIAGITLSLSVAGAAGFYRLVGSYLDVLDKRVEITRVPGWNELAADSQNVQGRAGDSAR